MMNVISLDIETRDPEIKEGHGYLNPDFKILDCGASYFDENGVLVSCHFDFINKVEGLNSLTSFLDKHKFDKLIFHNTKYDLPALKHYGFPFRKYEYSDTMMLSTLLEPFRPSHSLGNLCKEYDIPIQKISDRELVIDIIKDVLVEVELRFSNIEKVTYDNNKELYIELLATAILGKGKKDKKFFDEKTLSENTKFINDYMKKTYGIELKKVKTHLAEVKQHFPEIYYEYLTTDTEATLLLYYKLTSEIEELCEDFDSTFTMEGRTLKDVVKTEEENIKTHILMSTTPLALDWEKIDTLSSQYEENLAKIVNKYPLFFHETLEKRAVEHPDYKKDPEFVIDFILARTLDTLRLTYPNMFQREVDIITYAMDNLTTAKDKLLYAKQSFLFQDIDSVQQKEFKAISKHYLGEMDLSERYLNKNGTLSLSYYTIKQVSKNPKVTLELLLIFEFIAEINKIDINYTKFLKPFNKYRVLKGDLYTQLHSYKTASGGKEEDEKGTATGRMSSNHFNVQTLPKADKDTYGIRSLFLPRSFFFKQQGCVEELAYLSIDWAGQETRLFQVLSDCKKGLAMYRENQWADAHLGMAASILATQHNLSEDAKYTAILLDEKSAEKSSVTEVNGDYVIKVSKVDRGKAKAVVFGVAYKIGAAKLAEGLGITEEEAYKLLKDTSDANPEYLGMYKQCIRTFAEKGYVANRFGRIYKPYKLKKLYKLSLFEKFFKLETTLNLTEKGVIMEDRKRKIGEELLPNIWDLPSEEFHKELMKNIAEYRDMTPLLDYEDYVKMYDKALKGIYEKDTMSNVVYVMLQKGLFHNDKDMNIKDIIALHGKFIFKDSNGDYAKECNSILGKKIESKFSYNSAVKKLRGGNLEEWSGEEDLRAVRAYMKDTWSWHICNHSIERIYDFLKKIVNAMCQGTGADMLKEATAKMWKDGISDPESPNFIVDLNFPVHDDLNMTMVKNSKFEENIKIIKSYMEFEFKGVQMLTEESVRSTCLIN